ncbi:hypothetical protein SEA_MAGUCO_60 [Arthrobacter phage MaGuCo]|uniref:Uncharacterized protein n=1 Tax=Arthrobacter phage MaGuCo TaxID=3038363 RepID=A0AAF0GHG3_9CAUD|nr:hypothetical protein SEA_MAGUCO_60 [Arthrobacter phage MaGuCo]
MRALRGLIYRLGGRPRLGSIWHSPSLHLICTVREADVAGAFRRGIERSR